MFIYDKKFGHLINLDSISHIFIDKRTNELCGITHNGESLTIRQGSSFEEVDDALYLITETLKARKELVTLEPGAVNCKNNNDTVPYLCHLDGWSTS